MNFDIDGKWKLFVLIRLGMFATDLFGWALFPTTINRSLLLSLFRKTLNSLIQKSHNHLRLAMCLVVGWSFACLAPAAHKKKSRRSSCSTFTQIFNQYHWPSFLTTWFLMDRKNQIESFIMICWFFFEH